jgi:hypothetical protein
MSELSDFKFLVHRGTLVRHARLALIWRDSAKASIMNKSLALMLYQTPSVPDSKFQRSTKREMFRTYRKHNDDVLFALDDNGKVKANLEFLEGFVDEDVLD